MSIPSSMQAVVIENNTAVVKSGLPIPELQENTALIRVKAVAANPTDFKHVDYKLGPQGSILGCDCAGEIVALGENAASNFSVGDTVCAVMHGASTDTPNNGAFAEYAVIDLPTTIKLPIKPANAEELPAGKVETFEGAAALPCAMYTAAQVLTFHFGNKLVWLPSEPQHDHPLLIWGGATACGQYAIQLAKKLNAYTKIVVVASKKHEARLKDYGADDVFDYHDANVEEEISRKYPNIYHALDAASFPESLRSVNKVIASDKPAKVANLTMLSVDIIPEEERKANAEIVWPLLYLISGHDEKLGPYTIEYHPKYANYRESMIEFVKFITPKLAEGSILHIPTKIQKGWESVPDIVDQVRQGKTNGSKLAVTIQ